MIFGQAPCNSGRRKRRNVAYLGLLPPPVDGLSDFTHLYTARYGEPRPGTRVFLVTCQQKDGWKAVSWETTALVPHPPSRTQSALPPASRPSPAGLPPSTSQQPPMHKGRPTATQAQNWQERGKLFESLEPATRPGGAAGRAPVGGRRRQSGMGQRNSSSSRAVGDGWSGQRDGRREDQGEKNRKKVTNAVDTLWRLS